MINSPSFTIVNDGETTEQSLSHVYFSIEDIKNICKLDLNKAHGDAMIRIRMLKVACRKKHFVKIVTSLVTVLLKITLRLCIYFVFIENPLF